MNLEKLAQNLRTLRVANNLTQEQISTKLNIQRQTYCNYENGNRIPSLEILLEISRVFHISLDLLVDNVLDGNVPIDLEGDMPFVDYRTLSHIIKDFQSLPQPNQQQVLDFIAFQKSLASKVATKSTTS